ncbi:MAG: hypothetical protein KAR07_09760 [Spirochaetes bacterium]|nr:hypothetical protein [Spirochaetota bacterium]
MNKKLEAQRKNGDKVAMQFTIVMIIILTAIISIIMSIIAFCVIPNKLFLKIGVMLFVNAMIIIGFLLPYNQLRKARIKKRKKDNQDEEDIKKWGFTGKLLDAPWVTHVEHPIVYESNLPVKHKFYSEWLIIHEGLIIVNPGVSKVTKDKKTVLYDFDNQTTYAWDGCTPKRLFFGLFIFGTPDGKFIEQSVYKIDKNEPASKKLKKTTKLWQRAFHASLIHDAMCQYLHHIPFEKVIFDQLFYDMLVKSKWWQPVAYFYKKMTSWFSPESKDNPYKNKKMKLDKKNIAQIELFRKSIKSHKK